MSQVYTREYEYSWHSCDPYSHLWRVWSRIFVNTRRVSSIFANTSSCTQTSTNTRRTRVFACEMDEYSLNNHTCVLKLCHKQVTARYKHLWPFQAKYIHSNFRYMCQHELAKVWFATCIYVWILIEYLLNTHVSLIKHLNCVPSLIKHLNLHANTHQRQVSVPEHSQTQVFRRKHDRTWINVSKHY